MHPLKIAALFTACIAASCGQSGPDAPPVTPQTTGAVDENPVPATPETPAPPARAPGRDTEGALVAQALVLHQWQRADNREVCAPAAFTATGHARGAPRKADFAGGWAVAFDLPNLRSAYGIAGPGLVKADRAPPDEQEQRLRAQWPYFRPLGNLPQPAFAGYGIEGAAPYPADNPAGRGLNSLAYVRIGDQGCTYNVWSRLGRGHLEDLLDALRLIPRD